MTEKSLVSGDPKKSPLHYLAQRRRRYKENLAKGLCTCGEPVKEGRSKCAHHLALGLAATRKRQDKYKEQGLCPCGKELAPGRKFCQMCLDAVMCRVMPKRRGHKQRAVELLGGACKDCGFTSDYLQVFDFHHLDPSVKDGAVSRMLTSSQPWEVIEAEVRKCALLCANCHRIRHAKEHQP